MCYVLYIRVSVLFFSLIFLLRYTLPILVPCSTVDMYTQYKVHVVGYVVSAFLCLATFSVFMSVYFLLFVGIWPAA